MTPEALSELELLDTQVTQLRYRRAHLDERIAYDAAHAAVTSWEQRRDALERNIAELATTIETAERDAAAVATATARLEAQLKTVIAVREAEALMHEIATHTARRDELDLIELEAMERQGEVEAELAEHLAREPGLRAELDRSAEALAAAEAVIDAELERATPRVAALREQLGEVSARYDRLRAQLGSAVAHLEGRRCTGCHLDLSAAEADDVRRDAALTGVTDCPNCGRILIVA